MCRAWYWPLIAFAVLLLVGIIFSHNMAESDRPTSIRPPTPTPRPLGVEYVDAAGIAQRVRERHARECTETAERAVETGTCSGLLQYAAHYDRYADQRRAGSKVYLFEIRRPYGAATYNVEVTYEQALACVNEGRACPKKPGAVDWGQWKDAMKEALLIIGRERARGNQ